MDGPTCQAWINTNKINDDRTIQLSKKVICNNYHHNILAAKIHKDTASFDKDVDYESMISSKVKSSDLQDIGIITSIIEDILCIRDKDNQYFGIFKDNISSITADNEVILEKSYSDILKSKVKLPEEVYKKDAIKEVELGLVTKGKSKRKGFFSFIKDKIRSYSPTVFSNDGQEVGRLLKASKDYLTILSFNDHRQGFEYKVKRSHIEEFDGWKLVLDLPLDKVELIMKGQRHMINNASSSPGSGTYVPPPTTGLGSGIASSGSALAGCGFGGGGGGGRGC